MKYEDDYDLDELTPKKKSSKDRKDILSQIKDINDDSYIPSSGFTAASFLPSSMLKEQPEKKKEKSSKNSSIDDADNWFNEMVNISSTKMNKKSRSKNSLFDSSGITEGKKKKKKDKEKKDLVDYRKEFEPEMALYKNLLMEQNRFTESLQKEYDAIKSVKSSARGINKQMTDLIANITSARDLATRLVEKNVNTKKLIAELTLKQKKELGESANGDSMSDYASSYLKQIFSDRQSLMAGTYGEASISDYTEEEMFNELNNSLMTEGMERSSDVDLYLKYENRNVEIRIIITDNDLTNYEFEAIDENGEIIDDYPMPNHTSISVNRSTNVATDEYGKKYNIIWR